MSVVVQENPANKNMHNPNYVAGIIPVPDSHYTPVLYSHYQATKEFNQLTQDIYEAKGNVKPADRKKTPKSVFFAVGAAAIYALWKFAKHIFKK